MDAIRQVVDGNLLNTIMTLPKALQDTWVEITVLPVDKAAEAAPLTRDALRGQLAGSHTAALSGALPDDGGLTLAEARAERRRKYERTH